MGRDGTGHLSDLPARRKRQEHECRVRRLAELGADPGHPMHGTMTGYRYGCRCERCRAARHEYHVRHYERRRDAMTADEARERIGEIRDELRRAMRAINRPEPDWDDAEGAASECVRLCAELQSRCWLNGWKERHGDR